MKLRLRLGRQTKVVQLEDNLTYQDLRTIVSEEFPELFSHQTDFKLSLNGTDAVDTSPGTPLSDLSIVHGDLVHVLLPQDDVHPVPSTESKRTKYEATNQSRNTPHATPTASRHPPTATAGSDGRAAKCSVSHGSEPIAGPSSVDEPMECLCDDDEAIQDSEVNKYLNEPMLVCDSTTDSVPQTLQHVYEEAGVATENEAICVLLHVLMSESGFSSGTQATGVERDHVLFPLMPTGWKAQKTYRLTYNHESCPGVTFTLICVPMGRVLVVHGTTSGANLGQKCQFQFQPSHYVTTINQSASQTFKNLSKLSRLFKDKIAYSIIQLCRQDLGHQITTGLLGLVEELKVQIFSHLDAQSLCRVSQAGQEFHRLAMQPKLWRRLYLRTFGRRTNNDLSQDWYKLYKEKHILRREMRTRMHQARCVMPPRFIPPPFAGPEGPFPYNPGFIGGDYDRYPAIPGLPGIPGVPGGVGPALPRPRFDPFGPLPHQRFPPGQGGGPWDGRRGGFGRGGGGGLGGGGFFL